VRFDLVEGLVLKRLNSVYAPGRRSSSLLKVLISFMTGHA